MEVDQVATKLRKTRRKRPAPPIAYTISHEGKARIHSAVASRWVAAVAVSRTGGATPSRPLSSASRSPRVHHEKMDINRAVTRRAASSCRTT
ncbi:unnamed protein product, partial [Sphacelaria rigidula]